LALLERGRAQAEWSRSSKKRKQTGEEADVLCLLVEEEKKQWDEITSGHTLYALVLYWVDMEGMRPRRQSPFGILSTTTFSYFLCYQIYIIVMHICNNYYTALYVLVVSAYPYFWEMLYRRIAVSVSAYPYPVSVQRGEHAEVYQALRGIFLSLAVRTTVLKSTLEAPLKLLISNIYLNKPEYMFMQVYRTHFATLKPEC
jgi:hypothetical protein